MNKIKDVKIGSDDNYVMFHDIQIYEDTNIYNAVMYFTAKNDFLQVTSNSSTFHGTELLDFFRKLKEVYDTLKGSIKIESVENNLVINVEAKLQGHISFTGIVRQITGMDNECRYHVEIDQSYFMNKLNEF
ncbi:hypothetical protein RJI07_03615 [Mycoplasmatota bacterium WC30]